MRSLHSETKSSPPALLATAREHLCPAMKSQYSQKLNKYTRLLKKDLLPQDKASKSKRRVRDFPNSSVLPGAVSKSERGNGSVSPVMLGTKGQLEFWSKVGPLALGINRTRASSSREKALTTKTLREYDHLFNRHLQELWHWLREGLVRAGEIKDQQENLQDEVWLRELWHLKGGFRASPLGGSWGWGFQEKVKVSVTQPSLTLWDPVDYSSPPGSSVHGILQARILEWVAIPLSRGSS